MVGKFDLEGSPLLPEALAAYWLPGRDTLPRDAVFPPGRSADEVTKAEAQMMETSQDDAVVAALRAAGLRIIDTILVSYTEVVANPAAYEDPDKRHAMGQLMTLLNGSLEARGKVLLKLNVAASELSAVLAVLPSAKAPTVSELAGGGYAERVVVPAGQVLAPPPGYDLVDAAAVAWSAARKT